MNSIIFIAYFSQLPDVKDVRILLWMSKPATRNGAKLSHRSRRNVSLPRSGVLDDGSRLATQRISLHSTTGSPSNPQDKQESLMTNSALFLGKSQQLPPNGGLGEDGCKRPKKAKRMCAIWNKKKTPTKLYLMGE